jgi:hypothetical protein
MAESIWSKDSGGGYEWAEFHVYRHPREEGRYVADWASGCSCYGYEHPMDEELASETPLDKAGVVKAYSEFVATNDYYFDAADLTDGIEQLQTTLR